MMEMEDRFLTPNEYSRPQKPNKPKAIVIHWTGTPAQDAPQVYNYFNKDVPALKVYGSAHYVVGLDGKIIHMIPDSEMAYHVGSKTYTEYALKHLSEYPNNVTIGIEMCVVDNEGSYTEATLEATIKLTAQLCKRYFLDPFGGVTTHKYIVGWKNCPKWFCDHPSDFELFRLNVKARLDEI